MTQTNAVNPADYRHAQHSHHQKILSQLLAHSQGLSLSPLYIPQSSHEQTGNSTASRNASTSSSGSPSSSAATSSAYPSRSSMSQIHRDSGSSVSTDSSGMYLQSPIDRSPNMAQFSQSGSTAKLHAAVDQMSNFAYQPYPQIEQGSQHYLSPIPINQSGSDSFPSQANTQQTWHNNGTWDSASLGLMPFANMFNPFSSRGNAEAQVNYNNSTFADSPVLQPKIEENWENASYTPHLSAAFAGLRGVINPGFLQAEEIRATAMAASPLRSISQSDDEDSDLDNSPLDGLVEISPESSNSPALQTPASATGSRARRSVRIRGQSDASLEPMVSGKKKSRRLTWSSANDERQREFEREVRKREIERMTEMAKFEEGNGKGNRKERRRLQNRLAQRAFRARSRIQGKDHNEHMTTLESLTVEQADRIDELTEVVDKLQKENASLRDRRYVA